jgi:hypothetical protein
MARTLSGGEEQQMFRDLYADRYEVRVRFTESLMWEWEIWDVHNARQLLTSAGTRGGRFLSSRDAYNAGCQHAAAVLPVSAKTA